MINYKIKKKDENQSFKKKILNIFLYNLNLEVDNLSIIFEDKNLTVKNNDFKISINL